MKMFSLFFLESMVLIVSFLSCQKKESHVSNSLKQYHYDFATGKCINDEGEEGYNPLNIEQAQKTKDCECMDLSKQDLNMLLKGSTEESHPSKPLVEYNFRGAKMDSASLKFNYIFDADLRGAKMKTLQYGYAKVNGRIDQYTELPLEGACITKNNSCTCFR